MRKLRIKEKLASNNKALLARIKELTRQGKHIEAYYLWELIEVN